MHVKVLLSCPLPPPTSLIHCTSPAHTAPASPRLQAMRQQLGGERRRELFSFACAGMVELDLAARLALLLSQDTGARLQYVLAAVQPHLEQLRARAAVKDAVGGGEA